jgi:hypothetical protein
MEDLSLPSVYVHDPTRGRFGNAQRIEHCKQALLDTPGFDHIAFHTSGQDFTADVLDHRLESDLATKDRQLLSELGNQLAARFKLFEQAVRPWQSGVLIRLVLHGPRRLVVCNAVTAEQLIVASGPLEPDTSLETALALDRRAAALTDALRAFVNLPSQDPGGFRGDPPTDGVLLGTSSLTQSGHAVAGASTPCMDTYLEHTGVPGPVADELCRSVDAAHLHYAAHVAGGVWRCAADLLAHPGLTRFFSRSATVDLRRAAYQAFGTRLCSGPESLIGQLTLDAEDMIGNINRVVIDVEQGAFYAYRLGSDDFVLGVTVDQRRVADADLRMAKLAGELSERSLRRDVRA